MERTRAEINHPPAEELYARVFRELRPRTPLREIAFQYCHFANGHSTIQWRDGCLTIRVADLFAAAPEDVQEALARILIGKLFRKPVAPKYHDRYRRCVNRRDTVRQMEATRRERGRKRIQDPEGEFYNLIEIFEDLNLRFFFGLMARPEIGWSPAPSRTILGHYDSAHHAIVLSRILDQAHIPRFVVEYVMYHEMLHLRYPDQRKAGRRCIHTKEFRRAESEFYQLEEANTWLRKICSDK